MLDQFDPSQIEDESLRQQFIVMVNWLEKALAEIRQLKEENAALKDELTRLKGGQGRPPLPLSGGKSKAKNDDPLAEFKLRKPPTPASPHKDHSRKDSKNAKLVIDRVEILKLDKAELPKDAVFKGYEEKKWWCRTSSLKRRPSSFGEPNTTRPSRVCPTLPPCPPVMSANSGQEYGPGS